MDDWSVKIGLEVHARLQVRTKLFCSCPNRAGMAPNTDICPVCAGMPGALPVLSREAVRLAIRLGTALNCALNERSEFDRKSYFYPDMPAGYQITQYRRPICGPGGLELPTFPGRIIEIERIHLETDAGRSLHPPGRACSLVDLNRAGVGLVEIVTRPQLRSPEEAVDLLRELRLCMLHLGVCDGNMEDGSLRCDANISLTSARADGAPVEVKNLNSFRHLSLALAHEQTRQAGLLDRGEQVLRETRLYSPELNRTRAMRSKEGARDYRYFPEPDLPPLVLTPDLLDQGQERFDLPASLRLKLIKTMGLAAADAEILISSPWLIGYFLAIQTQGIPARQAAVWVLGEVLAWSNRNSGSFPVPAETMARLIGLTIRGHLSLLRARDLLHLALEERRDLNLDLDREEAQVSDPAQLQDLCRRVLDEHREEVVRYLGGKKGLLGFFVGQAMALSQGKANPGMLRILLEQTLEGRKQT